MEEVPKGVEKNGLSGGGVVSQGARSCRNCLAVACLPRDVREMTRLSKLDTLSVLPCV